MIDTRHKEVWTFDLDLRATCGRLSRAGPSSSSLDQGDDARRRRQLEARYAKCSGMAFEGAERFAATFSPRTVFCSAAGDLGDVTSGALYMPSARTARARRECPCRRGVQELRVLRRDQAPEGRRYFCVRSGDPEEEGRARGSGERSACPTWSARRWCDARVSTGWMAQAEHLDFRSAGHRGGGEHLRVRRQPLHCRVHAEAASSTACLWRELICDPRHDDDPRAAKQREHFETE